MTNGTEQHQRSRAHVQNARRQNARDRRRSRRPPRGRGAPPLQISHVPHASTAPHACRHHHSLHSTRAPTALPRSHQSRALVSPSQPRPRSGAAAAQPHTLTHRSPPTARHPRRHTIWRKCHPAGNTLPPPHLRNRHYLYACAPRVEETACPGHRLRVWRGALGSGAQARGRRDIVSSRRSRARSRASRGRTQP